MPELAQNPTSLLEEEALGRYRQPTNQPYQPEPGKRELDLDHRELKLEAMPRDLAIHQARVKNEQDARDPSVEPRVIPHSQPQLRPRARTSSQQLQSRQSQDGMRSVLPLPVHDRVYAQHSYSTSQLVPPSPSIGSAQAYSSHEGQSSYESSSPTSAVPSHGPNCGCANCNSMAKSKSPQSPNLRSPIKPRERSLAEKPKTGGWMKRFSMPVGNALGLDSKKGISNTPAGTSFAGGQNKISSNMALRSRAVEERWGHLDTADGTVK